MLGFSLQRNSGTIEFFHIITEENFGVTNCSTDCLQLVQNKFRVLRWECAQVDKTCAMVFDCHHTAHQNTKRITLSEITKIN
jgi:hypothetical protein